MRNFAAFRTSHGFEPPGGFFTLDMVRKSSAGIDGWSKAENEPDTLLRVGKGLAPKSLCGLWAKQALNVLSSTPQWERVVLTVDSGASDTVLPPKICSNIPLAHSSRVGTEYEVANGGTVVKLGERKAEMKLREGDTSTMIMSFQVVEVHKPLLAVSKQVIQSISTRMTLTSC